MGRIQFTGENADEVIKESQGLLKKVTLSDFDNEEILIGKFKEKFIIVTKYDFYCESHGYKYVNLGHKLIPTRPRKRSNYRVRLSRHTEQLDFNTELFFNNHKEELYAIVRGVTGKPDLESIQYKEIYKDRTECKSYYRAIIAFILRELNFTWSDIATILQYHCHTSASCMSNKLWSMVELQSKKAVKEKLIELTKYILNNKLLYVSIASEKSNKLD